MAGVQIPRIDRAQPIDMTPASPKLNVEAPNVGKSSNLQLQAAGGIVEDQANYFAQQEKAAVDTASKAAANEYNIYLNSELNKAKLHQGDPSSVYAQFNENMNTKFEEILNKNPNLSDSGKQAVRNHLSDVFTSFSMKANTAYSGQYYDYDKKVTDDAVKLTAQDFMTASSYIDPKDEKSFQAIDALIGRIGNLYKTHGEKFGAVTRDENGNQIATDGINLEIAKATSEGLSSAIQNLNDAGRPDLADAMFSKYYKYIDIKKQDDLKKATRKEQERIDVYDAVDKTRGMSPEGIDSFLNKKFSSDPELKSKAYEAIDARSRHVEQIRDRSSKKNYQGAAAIVSQVMSSDKPFANVTDMQLDPRLSPLLSRITNPKEMKALEQMIKQPAESNVDAKVKFYDAFQNGELKGMSFDELNKSVAGLNKADRTRATRLWEKYNAPQTTAEETRMMNNMGTMLTKQLQSVGYVKKNEFGKYTNKDQIKITQAYDELVEQLDKLPPGSSYRDQLNFVQKYAADKAKGEVFAPPEARKVFDVPKTAPTSTASPFENTTMLVDRKKAALEFKTVNKRWPVGDELDKFMQKKK